MQKGHRTIYFDRYAEEADWSRRGNNKFFRLEACQCCLPKGEQENVLVEEARVRCKRCGKVRRAVIFIFDGHANTARNEAYIRLKRLLFALGLAPRRAYEMLLVLYKHVEKGMVTDFEDGQEGVFVHDSKRGRLVQLAKKALENTHLANKNKAYREKYRNKRLCFKSLF